MKKIAFFHPYFRMGGVEKTNIRLARYFIGHGYTVDFLSLSFTDHFGKEMKESGIRCVTLSAKRTASAVFKLREYIRREQDTCEHLYLISCQNFANLSAALSVPKDRSRVSLILSERLHPAEFLYNGKAAKGKIILFLMRLLYKRADAVVANSKETAAEIKKITGVNVRCIYNPTLEGDYEKKAKEPVDHPWFARESSVPVIASAGRLSVEKGYDVLLKAFAEVLKQTDSRLVIVGDGEKKEELEKLAEELGIREKLWLPGYDGNPYKYVSKAAVFVLSSRFEGLPNTLIEALAVGTPCVATDCKSGPREILLDGAGGLLAEVDDVHGMADAICEILRHPKAAHSRLELAQEMLYRFTPDEVGKQYEGLLLDALHGKCGDNQGDHQ